MNIGEAANIFSENSFFRKEILFLNIEEKKILWSNAKMFNCEESPETSDKK